MKFFGAFLVILFFLSCLQRNSSEDRDVLKPDASVLYSSDSGGKKICSFAGTTSKQYWSKHCKGKQDEYKGRALRVRIYVNCKEIKNDYIYQDIYSWYRCLNEISHPTEGKPKHTQEYGCFLNTKGHCLIRPSAGGDFSLVVDPNTPEGLLLLNIYQKVASLRNQITKDAGDHIREQMMLIDAAEMFADLANEAFGAQDNLYALKSVNVATRLLDTAADFTPGVSFVKDVTILITGINPITNEPVSDIEKAISLAFLLTPVALSGTMKTLTKTAGVLKNLARARRNSSALSEGLLKSIRETDHALKDFTKKIPCVSHTSGSIWTPIFETLNLFNLFKTAYADVPCSPVGEVTDVYLARLRDSAVKGGGVFGFSKSATRESLNPLQLRNLKRFEKKVPRGSKPTAFYELENMYKIFHAEVPGRVPGSKAIYEKVVNAEGKTTQYFKTTYDNNGKVVHIKNKIDGSVINRGD